MNRIDIWDAGGDESYLYTEDWSVARGLRSEFPPPTVYYRGTQPFAWQFVVPKRIVAILRKKILLRKDTIGRVETEQPQNTGIEIQGVTAA
jgi:hypothetical protein